MFAVFASVKKYLKCKKLHIDQSIFRLHYKISFFVLLASSALVGSKQYAGEPIKCSPDTRDSSTIVDIYCFITSTYTVKSALNKTPSDGAPHPGIFFCQEKEEYRYHVYYQWIGFLLFFQALLFYFPHWLWKCFEGGQLMQLLEREECDCKDPDVIKLRHRNKIARMLKGRWTEDKWYCTKYLFCEFLCLVNVLFQMFVVDKVFNNDYLYYGIDVIYYFYYGSTTVPSPFDRIFPRVTSCTYRYFGEGGKIRKSSVLCLLAVNAINEKIFLIMWFWFVILIVLTSLALISKLILFCSKNLRFLSLKFNFRNVNPRYFRFIVDNGNAGDYLLVYLLGQNLEQTLFTDAIVELVSRLQEKQH